MAEGLKHNPQWISEREMWDAFFATPDPWKYNSQYELEKYRRTLSLFPVQDIEDALELGCSEGIFTEMLAERARRLLAADISTVAMERARQRCERFPHVRFEWCDIARALPSGEFDVITCSEILYYLQDRYALQDFVQRVARLLKPGGSIVAATANVVSDDPDSTGFDFAQLGAKFIGETFAREPSLEFSCELRTPLYRVQRFRKVQVAVRRTWGDRGTAPMEVIEKDATFDNPDLKIGGCAVVKSEALYCYRSRTIPILMYHRIADDGPLDLAPYRVTPEMFARQMQFLHRHGYQTVSVEEASRSYGTSDNPRPGRLIALTFDDGYRDFKEVVWPILRRYGFSATVYLPTDFVGGHADWDARYGPPAPLLSWDEIRRLSAEGVRFGGHSRTHRRLTTVDRTEWFGELNHSREAIQSVTGQRVTSFCYPFGDYNPDLRQAVAEVGYDHAVAADTTDGADLFALPRIDVPGSSSLDDFVGALPPAELAPEVERLEYRRLRALKDRRLYDV